MRERACRGGAEGEARSAVLYWGSLTVPRAEAAGTRGRGVPGDGAWHWDVRAPDTVSTPPTGGARALSFGASHPAPSPWVELGSTQGVVWCGVVWCGVVWCGVVWCGVVWCGVVRCGAVRCGVVCRRRCYQRAKGRDVYPRVQVNRLGCVCCVRAVRKCVGLGRGRGSRGDLVSLPLATALIPGALAAPLPWVELGSTQGVVWCGVVWCGVVWCGAVRCGAVRCGAVWCGVVWCGGGGAGAPAAVPRTVSLGVVPPGSHADQPRESSVLPPLEQDESRRTPENAPPSRPSGSQRRCTTTPRSDMLPGPGHRPL